MTTKTPAPYLSSLTGSRRGFLKGAGLAIGATTGGASAAPSRTPTVVLTVSGVQPTLFAAPSGGAQGAATDLANPVRPVGRLGFDGRIPPGIQMDHGVRGGQVQAVTTGLQADQKHRRTRFGLEGIDQILTAQAFENAMRVLLAIGGSTNGIVHLTAIAGRMGFDIDLPALDRMGRETPVLLDLKPSGDHYMEDFHHAGGMATLLRELKPLLHLGAMTVTAIRAISLSARGGLAGDGRRRVSGNDRVLGPGAHRGRRRHGRDRGPDEMLSKTHDQPPLRRGSVMRILNRSGEDRIEAR